MLFRLCTSLQISHGRTRSNSNGLSRNLLVSSLMFLILGCALYISIAFRIGSLMSGFWSLGGIYSGRFNVSVMLAKCLEKTSATAALSERITSFSVIIGFFLEPDFSEKKGFSVVQKLELLK